MASRSSSADFALRQPLIIDGVCKFLKPRDRAAFKWTTRNTAEEVSMSRHRRYSVSQNPDGSENWGETKWLDLCSVTEVTHAPNDCVHVGFADDGKTLIAYLCGWTPPHSLVRLLAFSVGEEFEERASYVHAVTPADGDWR